MKIRNRLTLQFTTIVALILILFSLSIYYVSKISRYNAFKNRLEEKALNTVKLLVEVDEIDASLLKDLRKNYLQSLPEEFVRVYNKDNTLIFKDDTIHFKFPEKDLALVRKNGKMDFDIGDRQFVAISYKNNLVITASARNIYGANELKEFSLTLILGNLFCLVIILFSGKFFAKESLKPISKIVDQVEKIRASNLGMRLDEGKGSDEISQLTITFNKMFDRIEDAFERQKRFVANASHELRTPLTAITGEIEVALMKERSKDQYIEVLISILEEAKTLTKLSNDLLDLAQTGNIKGLNIEKININELLATVAEEAYKRSYSSRLQFEINDTTPISEAHVNGNKELLKTAIINVVENGFKFSNNNPVTLKVSLHAKKLVLRVVDKGIGMNDQELLQVLQPFYRGENVSTIPGNGIGLSLTERVIKLHDGKIEFISKVNKGTEVVLTLPTSL